MAFLAILLMVFIMMSTINERTENQVGELNKIELQRKAIFLIDSIVKNRNEENPLLGSAIFDKQKKRVLQNRLDVELLKNVKPIQSEEFYISKLSFTTNKEEIIFQSKPKGNCISIDRTVTIVNKIGKLEVIACEKRILSEP